MVKWLFPPELLPRLRNLSLVAVVVALATWLPHYGSGVNGLLFTLYIYELGALGIGALPWSDGEVNETIAALRAVRNAARSRVVRLWSRS